MEEVKLIKLLNILDQSIREDFKIANSIFILKELIKVTNFDLSIVGHSGIVLLGSNKSFAKKLNINGVTKNSINRHLNKLQDKKLIWRISRQRQEPIALKKNSRKGFSSIVFILPANKEFNPELYNDLKRARTFRDLDILMQKFVQVSIKGLKDKQLQEKILLARNYKDKAYKDNIRASLIGIWQEINKDRARQLKLMKTSTNVDENINTNQQTMTNESTNVDESINHSGEIDQTNKVLKDSLSIPNNSYENKKSTKAKIKPKQQVIKDTGREIYIH